MSTPDAELKTPSDQGGSVDSLMAAVARALEPHGAEARPHVRPLESGDVLGRYVLVREIGRGGMGTVWEARHRVSERPVAVKVVLAAHLSAPRVRHRFAREARLATAIEHPGIVRVHDVFETDDGLPVMVMDLLRGESLGDRLRREGRLAPRDACAIVEAVVAAVRAAHRAGVVHRDLKPDNVFLIDGEGSVGGRVRVLDFGIAKLSGAAAASANDAALTETGALLGTPQYMAPEQLVGERDVDERADVWALGVILYECLCGERPVPGNNVGAVVRALGEGPIASLRDRGVPVSAELADRVAGTLRVDRTRRECDLEVLGRLLRREQELEAAPGPARETGSSTAWRRARRGALLGGLAVLGLTALYAGFDAEAPRAPVLPLVTPRASARVATPATRTVVIEPQISRSSPWGSILDVWRRSVHQKTAGQVAVELRWRPAAAFHDGDAAALSRIRTGQIHGAIVANRALAELRGEVAALELPGLVDSWAKVDWVREHLREPLTTGLAERGIALVAFEDVGCERLMTRGHAVRRPGDLARQRIAVSDTDTVAPALLSVIRASVPVPLAHARVAGALEPAHAAGVTGVIATAAAAREARWTRRLDWVTAMPFACTGGALVVQKRTLDALAPDHQAVVTDLAMRVEGEGNRRARQLDTEQSLRLRRELAPVEISDADRRAWRSVFDRAAERYAATAVPPEWVARVQELSREIEALE